MKAVLPFLVSFFYTVISSQGINSNWYFGEGAGINFTSSGATILSNGSTNIIAGTATISCPNGNLMFYSDGLNVYNKNHAVMPNGGGLLGYSISSQNVIIVPQPNTPNIYYVFTVDFNNGTDGFNYSIVDMTLNGGLGDVTVKNINLNSNTSNSSKITATYHSNGIDVWVVIEDYVDYEMEAYLLSSAGINTIPVTSSVFLSTRNPARKTCAMAFNPAGNILANGAVIQTPFLRFIELYNFDKSTGLFTFRDSVSFTPAGNPQGVAFSPDGSKLYFTNQNNTLFQADMNAPSLYASTIIVGTNANGMKGVNLGPDNKIYVNYWNTDYIGCIQDPNIGGLGCNFALSYLSYSATSAKVRSYTCQLIVGKLWTNYGSNFSYLDTCVGNNTTFNTISNTPADIDSVKWDFDDPTTGALNFSNLQAPIHQFSNPGNYTVSLIVYYSCGNDTITKNITIVANLNPVIAGNLSFCDGGNTTLDAGPGYASYLWSNADINQTVNISTAGQYWVEVSNASGCLGRDTVMVTQNMNPTPIITGNLSYCEGSSTVLDGGAGYSSYLWSNGGTNQTLVVNLPGQYWVEVSNPSGCMGRDTVVVNEYANPTPTIAGTLSFCDGDSTFLVVNFGYNSYTWNNGNNSQSIYAKNAGLYWIEVTDGNNCIGRDSVQLIKNALPNPTIVGDPFFCIGSYTLLDAGDGYADYTWSNGEKTKQTTISTQGNYKVQVIDFNGCVDSTAINIVQSECFDSTCTFHIPNSFSPNQDNFNDVFSPVFVNDCEIQDYEFIIFDRWGETIFSSTDKNQEWDGKINGQLSKTDVYVWKLTYKIPNTVDILSKIGHVLLLK